MTVRSTLLLGAAFFMPIAGSAQAQQAGATAQSAPSGSSVAGVSEGQPAAATDQPASPTSSSTGAAAAQAPEDSGDEEDAIVVTGAKPRGSVIGDIPPENTLDARDVRATGATSINELLDAIAPQIGSAQGRGGERPVLLLNGQRISGFRELRDIPTEAIQRVEILPEEVALKYGYRADQKVVNIVLRQRFRSTVAQVGAGGATDGGYANGAADVTRLMIQRNGRTQFNLHAEGNTMLTEAERNIILTGTSPTGDPNDDLAARSLIGRKVDLRGSAIFNRQVFGNVSATLNTELEHVEGRSLLGIGEQTLARLGRNTDSDSAHAGLTLNWDKAQWHWNVTGNADWERDLTRSGHDDPVFQLDRARAITTSAELTATANGKLFKVPAGDASATVRVGASTMNLDTRRVSGGVTTPTSLDRTAGNAAINLDLPISRRGHDFSALGNLTLNANAEVNQLSDFGTLTKVGAGANFSPLTGLNFLTSWTREEGAPTINQLGDPLLTTQGVRIFDFTTDQTVLVTTITGGNPNLDANRRTVFKLGGYWKPSEKLDLTLRADFVHQTIDRPISGISVTEQIEAAFPNRFVRDSSGQLVSVNLTPVNFDQSRLDTLRVGFDFSKPLKSRRPSQAVLDQIRQQFGFPARGGGERGTAAQGPQGGAAPPSSAQGGPPPGPPAGSEGGGRGFGGFGGRGGGGLFGGGQNRGRLTFSLTDTITFVNKVIIAPGIAPLDYLHGDAAGQTGGTPRHAVQAQAGYFNNGLGARVGTNWRSGTTVDSLNGDRLRFSPLATFDLRLFANPGDIPELAVKHPWLRATQFRLEFKNVFNARPNVTAASGNAPLNYQPDLLDPLGRTFMITFRKLFLPPPSFFRQQFQREQQQRQAAQPNG